MDLLDNAKRIPRPFDYVLVYDFSCLSRNLVDVLRIAGILSSQRVFLYAVDQRLDSNDTNFRQLLILNGIIDEQYLVGLGKRIHRGQECKIRSGMIAGGKCYGYENVRTNDPSKPGHVLGVRQQIRNDEAAVVRRIFEMYSGGISLSATARTLNEERIPSPAPGNSWRSATLDRILKNAKYRGLLVWNKSIKIRDPSTGRQKVIPRPSKEWICVHAPYLRIVSDELWERAASRGSLDRTSPECERHDQSESNNKGEAA